MLSFDSNGLCVSAGEMRHSIKSPNPRAILDTHVSTRPRRSLARLRQKTSVNEFEGKTIRERVEIN